LIGQVSHVSELSLYKGVDDGQGSHILFMLFHTGLSGGQRLAVLLLG